MLMNTKHRMWCHLNGGGVFLHLINSEEITRIITNHQLIIKIKQV
nr:MAG TPA: hypothetical protein [Caudoviricetes sp.]